MPTDDGSLPPLTLVLGGARSGKSAYAEALIGKTAGQAIFVATAEPLDDEMRARIAWHKARRGPRWITVEEPLALASALVRECRRGRPMLVDCLTLWLSNLMLAERDIAGEIEGLAAVLPRIEAPVVLVANEVGSGIVPENAMARAFRDHAGRLNQEMAALADHVVLVVAGLPLVLKNGR
jgi:adenosylcobinamide kinase/adenosylcobinamide-phosphate guanylyltransferase